MRILVVLYLAATAFAAPASLSGKWKISRNAAGRASQVECTFTQKDGELGGTCGTDKGPAPLRGKVDGAKVTWTYKSDSEGGTVTVVYAGTAEDGKKMSGTVTAVEFGVEGEFTATLAQ